MCTHGLCCLGEVLFRTHERTGIDRAAPSGTDSWKHQKIVSDTGFRGWKKDIFLVSLHQKLPEAFKKQEAGRGKIFCSPVSSQGVAPFLEEQKKES